MIDEWWQMFAYMFIGIKEMFGLVVLFFVMSLCVKVFTHEDNIEKHLWFSVPDHNKNYLCQEQHIVKPKNRYLWICAV